MKPIIAAIRIINKVMAQLIQIGARTQIHGHWITLHSLRIMKAMPSRVEKPGK